ncbi:hypothetical protein NAT51_06910 [Flavobacterium amniphilum]|uniref:hypothetical protein n=1 Tax=Flavobacterium amniphilum TaxID=1834035 RepID=UPI00202AA165|nr:hypothetical protein [Flavobacterium amniphilum]MCL9805243.1 hypothetical protein [Flavobacterium amniphilum]
MKIVRNILAVVLGLAVGAILNMYIIDNMQTAIKLPQGVNPKDIESMKTGMHLFKPKHFVGPFLAHAIGVLVGAFMAARFGASKNFILAMIVGGFFLMGGIYMVCILPAPIWFSALDVLVAYIPMAYLGWKLSGRGK